MNDSVNDLVTFVRARLDERQKGLDWDCWETRDIAAKRAVLDSYERLRNEDIEGAFAAGLVEGLQRSVIFFAAIDNEHPDYNPKW